MAVNFIGGRNHWPVASHIMLYRIHLAFSGFECTTLVMIGTDCIGNNKSNYHTITIKMASCNVGHLGFFNRHKYENYATDELFIHSLGTLKFLRKSIYFPMGSYIKILSCAGGHYGFPIKIKNKKKHELYRKSCKLYPYHVTIMWLWTRKPHWWCNG